MKILQIIQKPELRGAEIFACQLSEELIKLGHEVDVVYLFPNESFDLQFSLRFIPLNSLKKYRFFDVPAFRRLARIITRGKYDLVQANAGDTLKFAVFSRLLFRWKTPLVYRNANTMSSLIDTNVKHSFNGFLLKQVDYVISVSENSRKDITSLYPHVGKKCVAIPIGTYLFDQVEAINDETKHIVIMNSASFVREKNHVFLIRVFKKFAEVKPEARLWLVGGGPLKSKVEHLVRESGLTEKVRFWGYRKDVISILKRADIMLMPSIIEGLPGAILEAFSCGVPVVASCVGGIPEVVESRISGFCLRDWNEDDYARAMEELADDGVLREQIILNARRVVTTDYLMPQIAARFAKTYEQVLN